MLINVNYFHLTHINILYAILAVMKFQHSPILIHTSISLPTYIWITSTYLIYKKYIQIAKININFHKYFRS